MFTSSSFFKFSACNSVNTKRDDFITWTEAQRLERHGVLETAVELETTGFKPGFHLLAMWPSESK